MTRPALKFIDCAPLDKTQTAQIRRQVRSHAARCAGGDIPDTEDQSSQKDVPRKRRRRRPYLSWTVPIKQTEHPQEQHQQQQSDVQNHKQSSESSSPLTALSGTTLIPASKSPVYHQPFVSVVLHNYLQHLAVAIPEIDGEGQSALLRTRWFPLVINSPLVFQVIVLFSASHYAAQRQDRAFAETILSLKQCALTGIRQSLSVRKGSMVRDELIAATAKMASYEAIYGTEQAYHSHMKGVEEMVKVRGGLHTLGLDGLMSRLLIFIDTNSAFLLNTHLHLSGSGSYFPRLEPFVFPANPSRFIGEV
ncbi:uncharacterized protein Z518_00404 [Rhinocladiella mackenziei CBS 650.93]|uniref:Uncharacterized protein n=1 Tax=Rhinocladiella mackenziei CBS 650.93 TaxID=1442369 RepID=A0A0D2JIS0_9EURO|nr:uncharacterized protein Z518_00404 [Rhinocladiella mackenziei CBS 650.93]KIX09325.1 hypothetical protein Z518_00404 [Rhinocladiella mackenziei CBS 650.93]